MKIGDVLGKLTDKQRQRLARVRSVTPSGLAKSYNRDWIQLFKDMTKAELTRALSESLDDNELRVVALRVFDGRPAPFKNWREDGTAGQRRQAIGIVKALCPWVPQALQPKTWRQEVAPRLREIGIESDVVPPGGKTMVTLQKIFF